MTATYSNDLTSSICTFNRYNGSKIWMNTLYIQLIHYWKKKIYKFIGRLNWFKSGLFLKYQIHVKSTSYQKNIKNKCEDMVIQM